MSSPIDKSWSDEKAAFCFSESAPSSLNSNTWIPDIFLYSTCIRTREYLAVHHAARHEFLARNAEEWPGLADQPFFVQADDVQATLEEYLGEDSEEFDASGGDKGSLGRDWHEEEYDMAVCDESEDQDIEMKDFGDEIEEQFTSPKAKHDCDMHEDEDESGWAEVKEQIDALI